MPDAISHLPGPEITEAIVLAGGLGTRLRDTVKGPKSLALVHGRPFLSYLLEYFQREGIRRFILALGLGNEDFGGFLEAERRRLDFLYDLSVEAEPLGTGGAIRLACARAWEPEILVLNGDSFFGIDLKALARFQREKKAECCLSLKAMESFDRYGRVELGPEGSLLRFQEKQFYPRGLINGGVYLLDREQFLAEPLPDKFSFERDYLEAGCGKRRFFGLVQDGFFYRHWGTRRLSTRPKRISPTISFPC